MPALRLRYLERLYIISLFFAEPTPDESIIVIRSGKVVAIASEISYTDDTGKTYEVKNVTSVELKNGTDLTSNLKATFDTVRYIFILLGNRHYHAMVILTPSGNSIRTYE